MTTCQVLGISSYAPASPEEPSSEEGKDKDGEVKSKETLDKEAEGEKKKDGDKDQESSRPADDKETEVKKKEEEEEEKKKEELTEQQKKEKYQEAILDGLPDEVKEMLKVHDNTMFLFWHY